MRSDAIAGAVRSLAWRCKSTWIVEVPEVDVSTSGPSTAARPQGGEACARKQRGTISCGRAGSSRPSATPDTTTSLGERLRIQNPDVAIRMFRSRQTKQGRISWVEACGSGIRNRQDLAGGTGGLRVSQKQDVTFEAAAVLHLALRAVLLSGQAQCSDRGKRTEAAGFPGCWGMPAPEKRNSRGVSAHLFGADPRQNGPGSDFRVVRYVKG